MHNKIFRSAIFLSLIVFAVVSIGGCGGSSSSFYPTDDGGEGGGGGIAEYSILDENYDTDGDGKINILDFDDIQSVSYGKNDVIQDKKISIPSRHYLKGLKYVNAVSADSFVVDLTAGTEYTVEISKGEYYNFPIGDIIPSVEIINPKGDELNFLDPEQETSTLSNDVIELSAYPADNPYMICFTFKPAETGSYKINLSQAISPDIVEDNLTLFVYKELRGENGQGAGYYTQYKFKDKDGNLSAIINMADIMALREFYNELVNDFEGYEERDIYEDDNGNLIENLISTQQDPAELYLFYLRQFKQYYGIFDDYIETQGDSEIEDSSKIYLSSLSDTDVNIYGNGNTDATQIPSEIYGLVYADKFKLGAGFFAITGTKTPNDALELDEDDLPLPRRKRVKSLYKTTFVSSQEDREKLSTTNVDASLQLGGFGFNAGYSGESSFKFGLTSTTLVIHYEQVEAKYRMLKNSAYSINPQGQSMLDRQGSKGFREEFGDYFVGGYKYGGTFDAFIKITTQTTEQLDKVKTKLSASFKGADDAVSADVANKSKNFLQENNATILDLQVLLLNSDKN